MMFFVCDFTDCVVAHNVRDVVFHPKHSELEFLVSGSFPRSVEVYFVLLFF